MAIDAKFTADFSQFDSAVKAASGTLKKLEGDAAGASTQVTKLATQSATSFRSAGAATQDWTKDLNKFDGILSAAGVNVSSQVRAIGELNAAASATAGSMSTLATAGVAVGVALAAWNLTAIIEQALGLDQKIADLATTMGLFPSVAAETKDAIDATIQKAFLASGQYMTYAEAVKYLTEQQKEHNLVQGYTRTAYRDSLMQVMAWEKEIETITARGQLRQFTADLESHDYKLSSLSKKYGVHVEAIEYYQRELAKAAELEKKEAEQLKVELAAALEAAKIKTEAFAAAWKDIAGQDLGWMTKAATGLQGMVDKFDALVLAEMAAQNELAAFKSAAATIDPNSLEGLTASYDKLKGSLDASGASATQQELAYLKYQQAFMGAIPPVNELGEQSRATGDQTEQAGRQAAGAVAGYQALGAAVQYAAGSFQNMYTQVGHATGYESSLRTMNDMMSEYGRAGVPVHGGLIPGAAPRPMGGVTVNVQGSVLSTAQQLASAVGNAVTQSYRQGGNRQPV